MSTTLLPSEFSDLEPFAAKWCLPTERERFAAAAGQFPMDEMQALYDAAMPSTDSGHDPVLRPVPPRGSVREPGEPSYRPP